jgi:hypothetical protein
MQGFEGNKAIVLFDAKDRDKLNVLAAKENQWLVDKLVACLDVCQGIPTPLLMAAGKGSFRRLIDESDEQARERALMLPEFIKPQTNRGLISGWALAALFSILFFVSSCQRDEAVELSERLSVGCNYVAPTSGDIPNE